MLAIDLRLAAYFSQNFLIRLRKFKVNHSQLSIYGWRCTPGNDGQDWLNANLTPRAAPSSVASRTRCRFRAKLRPGTVRLPSLLSLAKAPYIRATFAATGPRPSACKGSS